MLCLVIPTREEHKDGVTGCQSRSFAVIGNDGPAAVKQLLRKEDDGALH